MDSFKTSKQGSVLICVNEHPNARELLVFAAKLSQGDGTPWVVLHVEEPHYYHLPPDKREHVLRTITLAKEKGADIIRIQAPNVEQAIASFVRESQNDKFPIRHVVLGAPEQRSIMARIFGRRHLTVASLLSDVCDVHLVPLKGEYEGRSLISALGIERIRPQELFYSFLAVLVAMLGAHFLKTMLPSYVFLLQPQNIALIFLIAVVFVGGRWGLVPALSAAFFSHIVINYFYVRPYFQFKLAQATDLINLVLFFTAATMIALFSSHTRAYAQAAVKRERRTLALYQLQRLTAEKNSHYEAMRTMYDALKDLLEMEVAFFTSKRQNNDTPQAEYPMEVMLDDISNEALRYCWKEKVTTGVGAMVGRGSQWRFEPMFSTQGIIGVLGVKVPLVMNVSASFGRLLTAVADQCAAIIQRIGLIHRMEEAKISEEKEKLRSLLLSSVSHDLKTPLASIIGSLSVYQTMYDTLSLEHRLTLIQTALDEAQRLDSFITNILDMTRLESGSVKFKYEWYEPIAAVKRVGKRLRPRLRDRELRLSVPSTPIEIYADMAMFEQVLQNLIDNAIKYSPASAPIEVKIDVQDSMFQLQVRDYGKGIPEALQSRVFDKYERLQKEDSQVAGTGLGLAICKTIIEQMRGQISVTNHSLGGAAFTIALPDVRKAELHNSNAA